jgi:hypothetical protein
MWKPGQKVEEVQGVAKGEKATIEINPETGSHIQYIEPGWAEVWIRYDRDGERVGRAILDIRWQDIAQLRAVE